MGKLTDAVTQNNLRVVQQLLENEYKKSFFNNKINDEKATNGCCALHIAAFLGHTDIIECLLKAGATVDQPTKGGVTPLCLAAREGKVEAIQALLKAGANVNQANNNGVTPLYAAAQVGNVKALQALLKAGANVNQAMNDDATPLYAAAENGNVEAVQALIEAGANVNQAMLNGATPFFAAAQFDNVNALQALIEAGANVFQAMNDGRTPLYAAVQKGNVEAVIVLLKAGANREIATWDNKSPLDIAKENDHQEIVKLLQKKDASTSTSSLSQRIEYVSNSVSNAANDPSPTNNNSTMTFVYGQNGNNANTGPTQASLVANVAPQPPVQAAIPTLLKQPPEVEPQDLSAFLKLVAEGEQNQAEAMLQKNKDLALASSEVNDLSNRTFKNITGFQYAVWALDWHMWSMIRKHLPDEEATNQLKAMETGAWVTQHGKSASWQNLLDAIQEFIDLCNQSKWDEAGEQWNKKVGGAQCLLPAHVVNEYCHPTRPFEPCPDFTKPGLPRSREMGYECEWFTAVYNGGKLGDKFACYRHSAPRPGAGAGWRSLGGGRRAGLSARADHKSCHALLVTRAQQRDQLFAELVSKNSQAEGVCMEKLIDAVNQNNLRVVQQLLENKYKKSFFNNKINDEKDTDACCALHRAAILGYTDIIECLLKAGAMVDQTTKEGITPLYFAAREGKVEAIQALLKAGAKVNQANNHGVTPLYGVSFLSKVVFGAIFNGQVDTGLLVEGSLKIEHSGATPLFAAVQNGNVEAVIVLIKAGANVNQAMLNGATPLFVAAQFGDLNAVQALIQAGANVNQAMNDGRTPLYAAASNGRAGALQALIEAGATVDNAVDDELDKTNNENGNTPLYAAAKNGNVEVLELLIIAGATVDKANALQKTPLYAAAQNGNVEVLEVLIIAKANVDWTTNEGANSHLIFNRKCGPTPLYAAAQNGHVGALQALLKAGANTEIATWDNKSPLDIAKENNHQEIVNLLPLPKKDASKRVPRPHLAQSLGYVRSSVSNAANDPSPNNNNSTMTFVYGQHGNNANTGPVQASLVAVVANVAPQPPAQAAIPTLLKQPPKVEAQDLSAFLELVAEGEQDPAEAMLQKNKDLALLPSDVTDLSNCTFKNITAFQYAVWALDWHMWTMIRKYLPDEEARKQIEAMETGAWVTQHGKSASWQNLLDALQKFIDLCNQKKWEEAETQWQKQVGGAQRLLPVHVVNEYCHPTRAFEPCPDFTKSGRLPRSRKMDKGEWFTAVYNGGKLGEKFACYRYADAEANAVGVVRGTYAAGFAPFVHEACHALLVTRVQQRDQLFAELVQTVSIKPLKADTQPLTVFLKLVAEGEQDQVEAMLQKNKALALVAGNVTDLSNRTFKNITGFQYAVWALDWHMWSMIKKYMQDEDVRAQVLGCDSGEWVKQHGMSANWQSLVAALNEQVRLLEAKKWNEAEKQWKQSVGGAQRLLPVHVVNEYCHPSRSFEVCPNFREGVVLPRTRNTDVGDWYTSSYNGGQLGEKFAVSRGSQLGPLAEGPRGYTTGILRRPFVKQDSEASRALLGTRTEQREQLVSTYAPQKKAMFKI